MLVIISGIMVPPTQAWSWVILNFIVIAVKDMMIYVMVLMILVFVVDVVIVVNNNVRYRSDHSNCIDVCLMLLLLLIVVIKEDYYCVTVFKDAAEQTVPEVGIKAVRKWGNNNGGIKQEEAGSYVP